MQRQSLIKLIHVNSASGFSCVTAAGGGEGWDDMLSEQFQPTIDHHASTGGGGVQSSISASFTHVSSQYGQRRRGCVFLGTELQHDGRRDTYTAAPAAVSPSTVTTWRLRQASGSTAIVPTDSSHSHAIDLQALLQAACLSGHVAVRFYRAVVFMNEWPYYTRNTSTQKKLEAFC